MVGLLGEADLIYIIGSKRAFAVTAYLSLTLSQQGVRNVLVDNVGSTAFDQVACIGSGDAFSGGGFGEAGLIYIIGSKRAFAVTAYLSLTLSQQGVRNMLVDNVGSTAFDQVACIGSGDAVLAVSFSPYNSITPDLVAVAHERNARIVTITDSTFSPLVRLSDIWIEVIEDDFAGFRSLAATLTVGMALVHGIARAAGGVTGDWAAEVSVLCPIGTPCAAARHIRP